MKKNASTNIQALGEIFKILISLINAETKDARRQIIEANSDIFMMAEIFSLYEKLRTAFQESGNHEVCKKINACLYLVEKYQNDRKKRYLISNELQELPEPLRDALEDMSAEKRTSIYQMINKQGKSLLTVHDVLLIFHFSSLINSFHILNHYPELMSNQADEFLTKMMADANQNNQVKIYKLLDTDRSLVRRCKQIGIKEGYTEFLKGELSSKLNLDQSEINEDMISLILSCKPQDLHELNRIIDEGVSGFQELSKFSSDHPALVLLINKVFGIKRENFTKDIKPRNFDVLAQMLSKYI